MLGFNQGDALQEFSADEPFYVFRENESHYNLRAENPKIIGKKEISGGHRKYEK